MAKESLSVCLYRNGKCNGEIRTFGGNKPDVKWEFERYSNTNIEELIKSFPRVSFQKGDKIVISSRWGIVEKEIEEGLNNYDGIIF